MPFMNSISGWMNDLIRKRWRRRKIYHKKISRKWNKLDNHSPNLWFLLTVFSKVGNRDGAYRGNIVEEGHAILAVVLAPPPPHHIAFPDLLLAFPREMENISRGFCHYPLRGVDEERHGCKTQSTRVQTPLSPLSIKGAQVWDFRSLGFSWFYSVKSLWEVDFGVKIKTFYTNI
jgi:hypothetical protein